MQEDVVRTMVKERVNLHVHKKLSDVAGRDLPSPDDRRRSTRERGPSDKLLHQAQGTNALVSVQPCFVANIMVGNSKSRKSKTLLPHLLESPECQKRLTIQESGLNKIHNDSFSANIQAAIGIKSQTRWG